MANLDSIALIHASASRGSSVRENSGAEYPKSPHTELHEGDDHVDHPDAASSAQVVAAVAEFVAAWCATTRSA